MGLKQALRLLPEYRDYVWGGERLRPGISPTAEAWVVYENDRVASGPLAGKTLSEVAAEFGAALLGPRAIQHTGTRFPLLIKLLDCAQWLSLQVHPDDTQAVQLEGPENFGKTEAWHVLEAKPGAQLIAGLKPGTTAVALADAIRNGTIIDWAQYLTVQTGDTIFMSPGTIHALGPGMLIYEVQQTSDLTYRVWDWGRPPTENRKLHIAKSLAVSRPDAGAVAEPLPTLLDGEVQRLLQCAYFTLETVASHNREVVLNTGGKTFHALTVIEGAAQITTGAEQFVLERFASVIIPADCGEYALAPIGNCRVLIASV